MTDALMAATDRQEALSRAYVAAVAAGAGYITASMDFDRDGVDVQIRAGGTMPTGIYAIHVWLGLSYCPH